MGEELYVGLLSFRMTNAEMRGPSRVDEAESVQDTSDPSRSGSDMSDPVETVSHKQLALARHWLNVIEFWNSMKEFRDIAAGTILVEGGVVKINPLISEVEVDILDKEEVQAEKQASEILAEIALSRKRALKTQTEINRLKKKTQAILDKLQ